MNDLNPLTIALSSSKAITQFSKGHAWRGLTWSSTTRPSLSSPIRLGMPKLTSDCVADVQYTEASRALFQLNWDFRFDLGSASG